MSTEVSLRNNKFIAVILTFLTLIVFVHYDITNNFDKLISQAIYDIGGTYSIDIIIIIISSLGDLFVMVILAAILTIIRRTRKMGLLLLISIIILSVTTMYIKPLVGRISPIEQYIPKFHIPDKYTIEKDSMMPISRDFSFPSNHTARATAFIVIIGIWYTLRGNNNNVLGKLLWIYPLSIGFSRLYLLQNYFFDIVGGMLYGMIIGIILCRLLKLNGVSGLNRFN